MSTDHVTSFFDDRAAQYDSAYEEAGADGHALRARMAVTLRLLGDRPGRVLDAGMGPGRLLAQLEGTGWEVSGIDVAAEMVALARERLAAAGGRLEQARIEELPFEDESFDAVVATGVLEYSTLDRALDELARVLRAGGLAVVSYPNPRSLYGWWKTRVYYRAVDFVKRLLGRAPAQRPAGGRKIDPDRFIECLDAAGLTLEAAEYASFHAVPSPLELILPGLAVWLGERLEGSGPALGRFLAGQVVYAARKLGQGA